MKSVYGSRSGSYETVSSALGAGRVRASDA